MAYPEHIRTIVLANTAEAFSAPISYITDPVQRQERIRTENILSQRAFFWNGDNKVVITPTEIPAVLLNHNSDVLGFNNAINRSPKYRNHSLCRNIMDGRDFLEYLMACIYHNPGIQITAYAYTKELAALMQKLKEADLDFIPTEIPHGNLSIVSHLDSKAGFRQVASHVNDISLPRGDVCADMDEVKTHVLGMQTRGIPFVVKANEGESGWGLFIGKDRDPRLLDQLDIQAAKDDIWKSAPYVVEEYIDIDKSRGGGSPSTELYISSDAVEITYSCAQLFGSEGEFSGIALGKEVLDNELLTWMETMAFAIGRKYKELGYRGFFDVDFAVSCDNQLYALETNMRRTGGTHVFDLARRLFGDQWRNYLFYSNDAFAYANHPLPATDILDRVKEILFPIKGRNEGLVLSLLDPTSPRMGYILIGSSKQDINEFESRLLDIFQIR